MVLCRNSQDDKTNKSEKNDNFEKFNIIETVNKELINIDKVKKIKRRPSFKCMFDNKYWCSICEHHNVQCNECIKETLSYNKNKLSD